MNAEDYYGLFYGPSGELSSDVDLYPSPLPQARQVDQRESPTNIGRRVPVQLQSGLTAAPETQLIAARINRPRQWVITVAQAVANRNAATPWLATFDGSTYSNAAPFNAPDMPGVDEWALRLRVRWGAGGMSQIALFDYPMGGGTFGLCADTVNVDVVFWNYNTNALGQPTFTNAGIVPVVGAFLSEGVAADPHPLRWRERPVTVDGVTLPAWSVKPFSTAFRFSSATASGSLTWLIAQLDYNGNVIWRDRYSGTATQGIHRDIDLVPQAVAVRATNNSGVLATAEIEWVIGLT